MDSKALRLSIAAIITTMVLVAVVVYAANIDRINDLMGKKPDQAETEEVLETVETSETVYGEQIGDNLKGFLTADDFFDKSEQRPSVVVVVDNVPVPANAATTDGTTDLSDLNDSDIADTEYSYPDSEPKDKPEEKSEDKTGDKTEEKSESNTDKEKSDKDKADLEKSDADKSDIDKSDENKSETEKSEEKPDEKKEASSDESTTASTTSSDSTTADTTDNAAQSENTTAEKAESTSGN